MKAQELIDILTELGVLVVFNNNLRLWQIMIDDLIFYLTPQDLESFNREDLEMYMTKSMVTSLASGKCTGEISLH